MANDYTRAFEDWRGCPLSVDESDIITRLEKERLTRGNIRAFVHCDPSHRWVVRQLLYTYVLFLHKTTDLKSTTLYISKEHSPSCHYSSVTVTSHMINGVRYPQSRFSYNHPRSYRPDNAESLLAAHPADPATCIIYLTPPPEPRVSHEHMQFYGEAMPPSPEKEVRVSHEHILPEKPLASPGGAAVPCGTHKGGASTPRAHSTFYGGAMPSSPLSTRMLARRCRSSPTITPPPFYGGAMPPSPCHTFRHSPKAVGLTFAEPRGYGAGLPAKLPGDNPPTINLKVEDLSHFTAILWRGDLLIAHNYPKLRPEAPLSPATLHSPHSRGSPLLL